MSGLQQQIHIHVVLILMFVASAVLYWIFAELATEYSVAFGALA